MDLEVLFIRRSERLEWSCSDVVNKLLESFNCQFFDYSEFVTGCSTFSGIN